MLSPGTSTITVTPFRELPARRKTETVPVWLPSKSVEDGEEGEVVYKLSLVNGIPQMHWFEEDRVNEVIQNFETRDDDVFVCTYVKSGTTWTQQIITLLLHKGEQSEKDYREIVPWLEALSVRPGHGPRGSHPEAKNWTLEALKSTPNRRFMKSHANLKDLPGGSAKGLKVIYVARNPKDVIVSLYHMATERQGAKFRGFSGMLPFFVQGRSENGSWFNHVLEWWEAANADPEHVLFIKYESMLAAPEEYIRKIADFVGIDHTPDIIEKTAAASNFNAMKQNPKTNVYGGDIHLRKGGAGGWRNMFTVRESEEFDKIYKREMKGSGLTMDFGEGLVM